jgi:hypothetical protein
MLLIGTVTALCATGVRIPFEGNVRATVLIKHPPSPVHSRSLHPDVSTASQAGASSSDQEIASTFPHNAHSTPPHSRLRAATMCRIPHTPLMSRSSTSSNLQGRSGSATLFSFRLFGRLFADAAQLSSLSIRPSISRFFVFKLPPHPLSFSYLTPAHKLSLCIRHVVRTRSKVGR